MGVSTVITSGKGGVGKSTVSVGLGRALAQRGRRVLLIDCDAGLRSLDRMTCTEEALVFDLSDVIQGRCAPADAIYPCTETEGLFLLHAPSSGEDLASPSVMRRLVPLLKRIMTMLCWILPQVWEAVSAQQLVRRIVRWSCAARIRYAYAAPVQLRDFWKSWRSRSSGW